MVLRNPLKCFLWANSQFLHQTSCFLEASSSPPMFSGHFSIIFVCFTAGFVSTCDTLSTLQLLLVAVVKGSVVSFCLEVLFKVNIKVSEGAYWSTLFQITVYLKKACLPLLEKSALTTMGKGTWLAVLFVNIGGENDIHHGEGSHLSAGLGISHLSNVQGRCAPTVMTSSMPSFCMFEICLMIKIKSFFHILREASLDYIPPTPLQNANFSSELLLHLTYFLLDIGHCAVLGNAYFL